MEYKLLNNEEREHFIWKVYKFGYETGELEKEDAGEICREQLDEPYDESAYRKVYQSFSKVWNAVEHEYVGEDVQEHIEKIEQKQEELYKQQVKSRDRKRELRSLLSAEARLDSYNEVIIDAVSNLEKIKVETKDINLNYDGKAILKIGDWHIGKEVDNYFNKYNNEVAKERMSKLINETVKYCKAFNVGTLYLANLNDNIEGVLRALSRVESNEDLIGQIMIVSEMLSAFIEELLSYGLNIKYVSVLDNHSRANINYRDHIESESFVKLIDFYIKARVGNKIEYVNNRISDNVGYLEIDGKNHFFVHGHLKAHAIGSVIQNLALPLNMKVDAVHMGHWHKSFKTELHYSKVYINGSFCGVDDYAMNNGWHAKASQGLLILDGSENDIHIDINLN